MEACKLQRYNSHHCGTTTVLRAGLVILLSMQTAELI